MMTIMTVTSLELQEELSKVSNRIHANGSVSCKLVMGYYSLLWCPNYPHYHPIISNLLKVLLLLSIRICVIDIIIST